MRVTGLAVLAVLAGCAAMPGGGGRGLPEVAMRRATGDVVPPARGYVPVAVRSFVPGADGGWQEVGGAACRVAAGPYEAALVTPARLVVPDLGPDAPPIAASCARGGQQGRDVVGPAYPWPPEAKPNPAQRVAWAGWWDGYRKSGPLRYRDLAIGLR